MKYRNLGKSSSIEVTEGRVYTPFLNNKVRIYRKPMKGNSVTLTPLILHANKLTIIKKIPRGRYFFSDFLVLPKTLRYRSYYMSSMSEMMSGYKLIFATQPYELLEKCSLQPRFPTKKNYKIICNFMRNESNHEIQA
jgi:hypothetical protein